MCRKVFMRDFLPSPAPINIGFLMSLSVLLLLAGRTGWVFRPLDEKKMQEGADYLLGEHDFSSFRAAGCQSKTPIKTVNFIEVERRGRFIKVELKPMPSSTIWLETLWVVWYTLDLAPEILNGWQKCLPPKKRKSRAYIFPFRFISDRSRISRRV